MQYTGTFLQIAKIDLCGSHYKDHDDLKDLLNGLENQIDPLHELKAFSDTDLVTGLCFWHEAEWGADWTHCSVAYMQVGHTVAPHHKVVAAVQGHGHGRSLKRI